MNDWVDRVLADMKAHKDDFPYWVQKGWMSQNTADYYIKYGGFKVKKSYAYAAVQAEVKALTPLQYGDLSDILEGATRGKSAVALVMVVVPTGQPELTTGLIGALELKPLRK